MKRKLGVAYIEDGGRRVDSIEVSKWWECDSNSLYERKNLNDKWESVNMAAILLTSREGGTETEDRWRVGK